MKIETYKDWAFVAVAHLLVLSALVFLGYQGYTLKQANSQFIQSLEEHRGYIQERDKRWEQEYLPLIREDHDLLMCMKKKPKKQAPKP